MDTKALRQKILDLAIHGKLVAQDPDDEPASVLLKRIKAEKELQIKDGKIKKSKKTKTTSDTSKSENVPFEIPSSWELCNVSDLFLLNPKNQIDDETEVGFIPMTLVEDGFSGKHSFEKRKWKDVKTGYSHFQNGDIGIAKISPCFENLKSCILSGLPNNVGAGTTELVILRGYEVFTLFYLYVYKSYWYIAQGTKYFKGVVGQQRVNKEIFTDLKVPLPPLAEQKRIVAEIERWFALIDQIEQGKSDLQTSIKQTKKKILDLAIHGKLVAQHPDDEPASELLKRIKTEKERRIKEGKIKKSKKTKTISDTPKSENVPFEIPSSWEWCRLNDLAESSLGKTLDKNKNTGKEYPYLCAINVKWNEFDLSVVKTIKLEDNEKERYQVRKGDLLICEGGDVGRSAIWDRDEPIYYQNALHRVRFFGNIVADFYLHLLWCYKSYNWIDDICNGVTIKHFTQDKINALCFPLPPLAEQKRIVKKIEELFGVLDTIQQALE